MFCTKCGYHAADDAKFCAKCGNQLYVEERSSSTYSQPENRSVVSGMDMRKPIQPERRRSVLGRQLKYLKNIAMYEGEKKIGISKASGNMTIYDNRIEYHKTMGNSGWSSLGLVGIAISAQRVKNEEPVVFKMKDIAEAMESKYMGAIPAFLIRLANGEKYTFSGVISGSDIREAISYINRYKGIER